MKSQDHYPQMVTDDPATEGDAPTNQQDDAVGQSGRIALQPSRRVAYNAWMKESAVIQVPAGRVRFSGHESFPLRFSWLAKGVRFCPGAPQGFADPEAMVALGVGKNMVRSIRFWCLESQMIAPSPHDRPSRTTALRATELGEFLFGTDGIDPYLEDPATLWLVHWGLASRQTGPTTWYFLFNELRSSEFGQRSFLNELRRYESRFSNTPVSDETIERDWDCCIRCYVGSGSDRKVLGEDVLDCPLAELDLLHRSGNDGYYFPRAPRPSLPPLVFAACLVDYLARLKSAANTVSFDQVAYAPGSPGQVFRISENYLVDLLGQLEGVTDGAVSFGATAGLRQLLIRENLPLGMSLLRKHYKRRLRHAKK